MINIVYLPPCRPRKMLLLSVIGITFLLPVAGSAVNAQAQSATDQTPSNENYLLHSNKEGFNIYASHCQFQKSDVYSQSAGEIHQYCGNFSASPYESANKANMAHTWFCKMPHVVCDLQTWLQMGRPGQKPGPSFPGSEIEEITCVIPDSNMMGQIDAEKACGNMSLRNCIKNMIANNFLNDQQYNNVRMENIKAGAAK